MKCRSALMLALGALLFATVPVRAFQLEGAWVTSTDKCDKVFSRVAGKLSFTDMSDVYGGGFIVEGDQLVGKFARCKIKARKDDGSNVNLIAACATDIMLSSVQFTIKVLDADSIARLFPGMEDMEIRYHRCPSP